MEFRYTAVYSHGFGTKKDDRGLFTDIARALPEARNMLFDYNDVDDASNTVTVHPLQDQVTLLGGMIEGSRSFELPVNLICHSLGCVVAALLSPERIKHTVLISPPTVVDVERSLKYYGSLKGSVVKERGISRLAREDGTTTIVPSSYWKSRREIDPVPLYNKLAEKTDLLMLCGRNDRLVEHDHSDLSSSIKVFWLDTDHNFTQVRQELVSFIRERFGSTTHD